MTINDQPLDRSERTCETGCNVGRTIRHLVLALLLAAVSCQCVTGCGRDNSENASQDLEVGFQTASPDIRQKIKSVQDDLKDKNFLQAAKTLLSVVTKVDLNPERKQAVGKMLNQINDAISADPKLDSPEMYHLRQQLFKAIYSK